MEVCTDRDFEKSCCDMKGYEWQREDAHDMLDQYPDDILSEKCHN